MLSASLSDDEMKRYMRQIVVQPFGNRGQDALKASRVLVVGAGGLGSPVIAYLAAAGVGVLGIADDDLVSISNLNRQILYRTQDAGTAKAERAAQFAEELNDQISVVVYRSRIDESSALGLAQSYDLLIDGSDNIATRRIVAAAALSAGRPLVSGAVGQLEGHVAVFSPRGVGVPEGFETLYPRARSDDEARCEAIGIIGAVAGVIGSLMAMEAIKILSHLGQPISGKVIHYDAREGSFSQAKLTTNPKLRYLVGG